MKKSRPHSHVLTSLDGDETKKIVSIFDDVFYVKHYGSNLDGLSPLEHYINHGEKLGYKPSFVFEPQWYLRQRGGVVEENLLLDYINYGEKNNISPSILFDINWFKESYSDAQYDTSLLSYYCANKMTKFLSPNAYFDLNFYFEHNPDVAGAGIDGYEHFVSWGVFEGRRGSAIFDAEFVWKRYLNNNRAINPFISFLQYKDIFGWQTHINIKEKSSTSEAKLSQAPGELFEEDQERHYGVKKAKIFAFYLPQFHAIDQNDKWWGKGFTEWTNLVRGAPRFVGHIQPKVPRNLGFYNLLDAGTIKKQIDMATQMGVHGFCYYYYNFDGVRLLEKPLDLFTKINETKFPFCLMWANENWTRRWDGQEQDILMAQTYSEKDEPSLIADIAKYFEDPAYYKIDGRPLLFIYRADIIPNCPQTVARWRERFWTDHKTKPIIVMAQTFGVTDPTVNGFDGAIEFPPHKFGGRIERINTKMEILDDNFNGDIRSYDDLIEHSLSDIPLNYNLIKTAVPNWDNDARKQGSGMVIHGSTPKKFENWMDNLCRLSSERPFFGEKLVFVNAWNEWCEGAYLEPDTHYGFAYGNSLTRALSKQAVTERLKILLVGHDAFPAGAQQLLLNIGSVLKFKFGIDVQFLLMNGGVMSAEYIAVAPTYVVDPTTDFWDKLNSQIEKLSSNGFKYSITNSIFSASSIDSLKRSGIKIASLVHELPRIIEAGNGRGHLRKIWQASDIVVFPNSFVKSSLLSVYSEPKSTSIIRAQGMYKQINTGSLRNIKAELNINPQNKIIINVGYADLRKGVDTFIQLAKYASNKKLSYDFVWVGMCDPSIAAWLKADSTNTHFVDFTNDVGSYLAAADVFLLTSREDPFPSVVLEALSFGVPVIAFSGTGGAADLLANDRLGTVCSSDDFDGILRAIGFHTQTQVQDTAISNNRYRKMVVENQYDFSDYCFDLVNYMTPTLRVSVIVPNYNYARYLEDRLSSIFAQKYPIYEVIVLDDASSDDSISILELIPEKFARDFILIENEKNSGNVFSQWKRGLDIAKGEVIWIAEADDLSSPDFLSSMVPYLADPDYLFAFCDSQSINESGETVYEDYKGYYNSLFQGALGVSESYASKEFVDKYLSVRNMILNASSIVWRKKALESAFANIPESDIDDLKLAGDWKLYVNACLNGGKIGYDAATLNIHRRHALSVTGSIDTRKHLSEIVEMHKYINNLALASNLKEKQQKYIAEVKSHLSKN